MLILEAGSIKRKIKIKHIKADEEILTKEKEHGCHQA
jgi:hypothetical protein